MQTFRDWLEARNIDQLELSPELAAALIKQWQTDQPEPVKSIILIQNGADERWSRAVRMEVGA